VRRIARWRRPHRGGAAAMAVRIVATRRATAPFGGPPPQLELRLAERFRPGMPAPSPGRRPGVRDRSRLLGFVNALSQRM